MLNPARIRAITLDLDDTLWPIMPTIERAEAALQAWLAQHAPATAQYLADPQTRRAVRAQVNREHAHRAHDLTHLRREAIRLALRHGGDDPALAEPAFEHFFAERQRVELYADVLPALVQLAGRYPILALSNGNADVQRVGLGAHFAGSVSAREVGVSKPDVRIFELAAERAGVAPDAVLHIGDDAELDVLAAMAAGMQTVWVNRGRQPWVHGDTAPHATVDDLAALCRLLGP